MVALFCVVAVVFDVAENLERLIDSDAPWGRVFGEYYVSFCLALGNMLSAFIVFLTILLFTSASLGGARDHRSPGRRHLLPTVDAALPAGVHAARHWQPGAGAFHPAGLQPAQAGL